MKIVYFRLCQNCEEFYIILASTAENPIFFSLMSQFLREIIKAAVLKGFNDLFFDIFGSFFKILDKLFRNLIWPISQELFIFFVYEKLVPHFMFNFFSITSSYLFSIGENLFECLIHLNFSLL